MELTAAIHRRRATRSFTQAPVPRQIRLQLVDAAVQAPSAVNEQPWDFTIVQNKALLDRISASSKAHMVAVTQRDPLPPHLREHLEDPEFHIFYRAPALIVISAKTGDWAVEDTSLAAENLMLAACEHGLGGFAQRWLETAQGKRAIDVPEDFLPIAPIIVGYPAAPMPPVPRNPPSLRWID